MNGSLSDLRSTSMAANLAAIRTAMQLMPQSEAPTEDMFADGVYLRVMHMKRGTVVAGATHKTEHFVVVLKGTVRIGDGSLVETFRAPKIILSKPGAQRILYAVSDATLFNIHPDPTNSRDAEKLAEGIIKEAFDEIVGQPNNIQAANGLRLSGGSNAGYLEECTEAD